MTLELRLQAPIHNVECKYIYFLKWLLHSAPKLGADFLIFDQLAITIANLYPSRVAIAFMKDEFINLLLPYTIYIPKDKNQEKEDIIL